MRRKAAPLGNPYRFVLNEEYGIHRFLEEERELILAFPDGFFGPPALGDIAAYSQYLDSVALSIA